MSKQAIDEITSAEAKAQKIKDDANARAKYMLEETNKTCASSYDKAEAEAMQKKKEQLHELSLKTGELLEKNSKASKENAVTVFSSSEEKMKSCSRMIVGRIITKWQL